MNSAIDPRIPLWSECRWRRCQFLYAGINIHVMSGLRRIIISAPHSLCVKPYRDCDTRAKESAEAIYRALEPLFSVSLHLSDLYRLEIDGNRRESRGTSYRDRLAADIRSSLAKYGKDAVMVLDVHSCWAGSREYTDDDGNEPVISLISFDQKTSALRDMIADALGKSVTCFESGRRNDITLECRDLGVSCILIEHDEDHARLTDSDFVRYVSVLTSYLTEYPSISPTRKLPPRRAGPSEVTILGVLIDEYALDDITHWASILLVVTLLIVCVAVVGILTIKSELLREWWDGGGYPRHKMNQP